MQFQSLNHLLEYRVASNRQQIFAASPEANLTLTYEEFFHAADQLAWHIGAQNVQKGQRVALIAENGLNWCIAFYGILLAGGIAVPLNPKFKPAEIEGLLQQAEISLILADHEGLKALPHHAFSDENRGALLINQEELIVIAGSNHSSQAIVELPDVQLADEALLLFTSGSTGVPKGVVLTHGNLLAEASFITEGHQLTDHDIVLCILPFFHINGLVITFISALYSGGKAVIPRKFSARHFWEWISIHQVTWFSAVPTILSILLSNQKAVNLDTSSLRFARSASSSLPVAILSEFENRYGIPVIEAYGLSEAGSQVATNPLPPNIRKAGSVGLPIGNKIQVVDEHGRKAPIQTSGEVVIKGENITTGYLNNPAANQESFKDGWFYTGDLGFFDADGYLFLTGRKKELINRAGEKISPREVDEILYQLSEVETAATVGVPDAFFGEEVVAFIQLRPEKQLAIETIIGHCKSCLADFKIPKKFLFIDDFPKGPNGKIQRRKLVEVYSHLVCSENNPV
ncbi:AMP-dependent ligase [Sporomusaceae bacterium FL31]|nr:AMP-dependent ligase [Sporomusaceae bacterium FL31]GCE32281.1 AMP-dependent ligase [Sporomusaceae bacterium]